LVGTACSRVVTTTADSDEADDGVVSLREAINCSNNNVGTYDFISFDIPAQPIGAVSRYSAEKAANDSVNNYDGTLQNGATFGPGLIGAAFKFDGVDDQITVPHNDHQNTPGSLSIDAWINPSSWGPGRPILQKQSAANVGGYSFESTNTPSNGLSLIIW